MCTETKVKDPNVYVVLCRTISFKPNSYDIDVRRYRKKKEANNFWSTVVLFNIWFFSFIKKKVYFNVVLEMTKVLKSSMRLLRFLGLQNKPIVIRFKSNKITISVYLVRALILISNLTTFVAVGRYSFENRSSFGHFSGAIFILVILWSAFFSYIDFIKNAKLVRETMEYLGEIVRKSTVKKKNSFFLAV